MVADGFPRGVESCSCSGTNLEHTLGNVHRTRAAVFHSTRFIKNTFCAKVFHSTTTSSTIFFFFCSQVKRELANSPAENTFYPSASERELAAATSSSCLNGTLFSWPDPRKHYWWGIPHEAEQPPALAHGQTTKMMCAAFPILLNWHDG